MDLRNNLFSKPAARGGAPGLPGRNVQQRPPGGDTGGYAPSPAGYGAPAPRSPMPPRQQNPPGGGYGGDGYGKETYGGPGGGYADGPASYQPQPRSRQVRLRIAKVEDKTLQSQYIFGNL